MNTHLYYSNKLYQNWSQNVIRLFYQKNIKFNLKKMFMFMFMFMYTVRTSLQRF